MHTFKKSAMKYKDANGVMQDAGVMCSVNETDTTLTKSGVAADAKISGEKFNKTNTDITDLNRQVKVERERINTFTALGEGSTTGDAELVDARVDKDGNTHANVGEHIRTVTQGLSKEIDDLNEQLFEITIGKNLLNPETGIVGYLTSNGSLSTYNTNVYYDTSDFIPVEANTDYSVTTVMINNGSIMSTTKIVGLFDVNKQLISGGYLESRGQQTFTFNTLNAVYVRVSGQIRAEIDGKNICAVQLEEGDVYTGYEPYLGNKKETKIVQTTGYDDKKIMSQKATTEELDKIREDLVDNTNRISDGVLFGKKYVACGDSFTAGDFTGYVDENGLSGKNSPVLYDSEWGMYKTYPWWIAKRNNMTLVLDAQCGTIMALDKTHVADPTNIPATTRNPFSHQRYKRIPSDADYITIWFGLNDANGNTNLGTIDDADNTTFYGAWNVILEYLLVNHPYAKIGIIVTDGMTNSVYQEAVREVAKKWGFPYLDLVADPQVPAMINGKDSSIGLCDRAKELRNGIFKVSSSNFHPSIKAHEYRSTIIENFLRSL